MTTIAKKLKRHTRGSLKAFVFMVLACFIGNVFYNTAVILHKQYIKTVPFNNYVEYYSVTPQKNNFQTGEELWFVSDSEYKKPVVAEWNDVLFCNFGEGFVYVKSYNSNRDYVAPRARSKKPWNFNYAVTRPAECYLESGIKIRVENGIEKTMIYTGEKFKIE